MKPFYFSLLRFALCSLIGLLLPNISAEAQTTLSAGDICFTLMNMEGNNDDAFGFVLLTDVTAGTTVKLTDAEYTTGSGFGPADEGVLNITFTSAFSCGTEVIFTDANPEPPIYDFQPIIAGVTVAVVSGEFSLTTAGETMVLFQSDNLTNPPASTFITALANTGVDFGVTATGSGDLPPGLTLGSSAMVMSPNDDEEWDNIKYDCSTTQNLPAALRTAIYNPVNWLRDNDGPLPTTACDPGFSCMEPCMDPTVTLVLTTTSVCSNAGVQNNLGGGTPAGGTYSGPGVTDNGNGTTFSFDPTAAGQGLHTITYDYTAPDGCSNSAMATIEVAAEPMVSFSVSLPTVCQNAGVQSNLGGGTPAGGTYSGPGVTDSGNGSSFSFDPAAAGVGSQTITYNYTSPDGCSNSATASIDVVAEPTVSFNASLTSVCQDAGVQSNVGGGSPAGGTYSGPGVTDDGNGTSFSFDPAAAGTGSQTITYNYTSPDGCSSSATATIEVAAEPMVSFNAPPLTVCQGAGIQSGLGGGDPSGGTYSGLGVTDDGNGTSFSFDPAAAGLGMQTITYTFVSPEGCSSSASATIEVVAEPMVSFNVSLATVSADAGVQSNLSGGSPTGGVYIGPGVTDDANGMTFSFDPAAAGVGENVITYTFTDANNCSDAQGAIITVTALALAGDLCADANDINSLFGGTVNEAQVSSTQDNTGYDAENDPGSGYDCWFGDAPVLNNTIWYAFTGDGEKYSIRSIQCSDENPMINTDTQFALYSGDCTTPVAVACNDDEDFDNQVYNSYLEITTEPGVDYLLMVDGYVAEADYSAIGTFCLEVTRLETVGVTDISQTSLSVYPNPTTGLIELSKPAERVDVFDNMGRLVQTYGIATQEVDLTQLPAGLYILRMQVGEDVVSARVVKE